ncbi:MAG: hypothetical protein EZS28_037304, partial [Streblomastix strix]
PLAQMTTRILNWAEAKDIQLQTVYIPGASNSTADALSRLARSRDYSITQVRAQQVMQKLGIQAQVDAFATRRNRVLKTYCSPRQDSRAIAIDGLAIDWNEQIAWLHPPIPLIGRCLQKILEDKVQTAILITPDWRAQFRRPTLDRLTLQRVDLGPFHLILTPGKHMKQHGQILPPRNMIASVVSQNHVRIKQERDYLGSVQWRRHAHGLTRFARYLEQQQVGIVQLLNLNTPHFFVSNWLSQIGQNESHSAVLEARTAINMLFDVIGMPFPQRLIQQVMKVHVRETAKVKVEEEIQHLDVLLNYISLLTVDINLSSTVTRAACMASLIAFTNLRLSELYDANILSISDQKVKLETMIQKGSQGRVQMIHRQLKNDFSWQVFWILKWRKFCTYMMDFTQTP